MKLVKLTDKDGYTQNRTKWNVGDYKEIHDFLKKPELCSNGVYHAYTNINLALLLNPIHCNFYNFKIFEVEGDVVVKDCSKVGCYNLKVLSELNIPDWYLDNNTRKDVIVCFAALCAESVLNIFEKKYSNDDRPRNAIELAKNYLKNKIIDTDHAADAAYAAADAADAAAYATADAADAAHAARAAAYAANAAADAANAAADADAAAADADAAYAADAAAYAAGVSINLTNLAQQAINQITK